MSENGSKIKGKALLSSHFLEVKTYYCSKNNVLVLLLYAGPLISNHIYSRDTIAQSDNGVSKFI